MSALKCLSDGGLLVNIVVLYKTETITKGLPSAADLEIILDNVFYLCCTWRGQRNEGANTSWPKLLCR